MLAAGMEWTPPVRGSKQPMVRDANHAPVTKAAHPTSNVTIAVNIPKNVLEVAISAAAWRIQDAPPRHAPPVRALLEHSRALRELASPARSGPRVPNRPPPGAGAQP